MWVGRQMDGSIKNLEIEYSYCLEEAQGYYLCCSAFGRLIIQRLGRLAAAMEGTEFGSRNISLRQSIAVIAAIMRGASVI